MGFWEYCWRICLSLLLGGLIGLERNRRTKEAGIRTHGIACVSACVFMLLSQFAFVEGTSFDASRIASTTVTGIAFLGAGIIYSKNMALQGLTTAAGVWATVAIGMCCGAGKVVFVYVAILVTFLIILFQFMFHRPLKFLAHKTERTVRIKFIKKDDDNVEKFKKFGRVVGYSVKREDDQIVCVCMLSLFDLDATSKSVDEIFELSPNVISAEFISTAADK